MIALAPATSRPDSPTQMLLPWVDEAPEQPGRSRSQHAEPGLLDVGGPGVVAAAVWNVPGELGFYCHGRPQVYALGPAVGERHSQYDLWRPNPVQDGQAFAGRTFIYVGEVGPPLHAAFAEVEPTQAVWHVEAGQPVALWKVTVCRGFRGFATWAGERY